MIDYRGREIPCKACQHPVDGAGWCGRCNDFGRGALEMEMLTEGLGFWDKLTASEREAAKYRERRIA